MNLNSLRIMRRMSDNGPRICNCQSIKWGCGGVGVVNHATTWDGKR